VAANAAVRFDRAFAPSLGVVAPVEKPGRDEICLDGLWRFQPEPVPSNWVPNKGQAPDLPAATDGGWDATPIRIPSPWNVNAFNQGDGGDFRCFPSYPKAWESAQMGWLRRSFRVPPAWSGRRIILRFDAVAGDAQVDVNGKTVAHNFDSFLPFDVDVTDAVKMDGDNELLVGVRKPSLFDDNSTVGRRPYVAGSMWGSFIVGIWQDVTLFAVPNVHVDNNYVRPLVSQGILAADVTVRNDSATSQTVSVSCDVCPWINLAGKSTADAPEPAWKLGDAVVTMTAGQPVTIASGASATVTLTAPAAGKLKVWAPETPNLYGLVSSVSVDGKTVDRKYTRFGWREFTFDGNKQLLNGKPYELRGDAWHFLGIPQMSRRYAWAWFKMLKDANANAVRLHAQPYPSMFLDVADEMGVCVLDETANWGSDGGQKFDSDEFWARSGDEQRRLVLRDRNHPAVFGWSLTNEDSAILDVVKRRDLLPRVTAYHREMVDLIHQIDPTRPWISGDGEADPEKVLPTNVGHYVGNEWLQQRAVEPRPFGVGESGGAYYMTPKQASEFVGSHAYVSQSARMDGIAIQAYELISGQRASHADYCSVFNLVWYGLQPLELGLPDTSRPPQITDGITFDQYREGVPGVQPERLGPYCSTLNPGYDPRLPLYRPWPLFSAVQAANAQGGPKPCAWDHRRQDAPTLATNQLRPVIDRVRVLANASSQLSQSLTADGVNVIGQEDSLAVSLLLVDGANPPAVTDEIKQQVRQTVDAGGKVWIMGVSPESEGKINALLPYPLSVGERRATSLIVDTAGDLLAGLSNSDLYFSETTSKPVMSYGLGGAFVSRASVLASACNTDWRRWNGVAEPIKTGAVLRSEREAKGPGAAIAEVKQGKGEFVVSALDPCPTAEDQLKLRARLLANLGVALKPVAVDPNAALSRFGALNNALVLGSLPVADPQAAYDTDFIPVSNDSPAPSEGMAANGKKWAHESAGVDGVFDLRKMGLTGPVENCVAYLSFWVWCPQDLTNLLLNPNLPKVDLLCGSDDGCQVYLNGKVVVQDRAIHPLTKDSMTAHGLPLVDGWNRFLVKVVQTGGEWGYQAELKSSDSSFLRQLRSSVAPPVK
jgi:beta-galactosidase